MYLLELFRYAVRVTTSVEPGTTLNLFGPGWLLALKYNRALRDSGNTYQVDDLTEMYFNTTFVQIGEVGRVVNKFRKFSLAHLRRAIPENEEQSVDGVGFSRTVGTNYGGKGLHTSCQQKISENTRTWN